MDNPTIPIFGRIGSADEGMTAKQFQEELALLPKGTEWVDLPMTSEGGSVSQGLSIVQQMKRHPAKFRTIVQGGVFSIAGFIAANGDERLIDDDALFHFHGPRICTDGNLVEHESSVKELQIATKAMRTTYANVTGKTEDEIEVLFQQDNFYDADEAVLAGFCTEVRAGSGVAARYDESELLNPAKVPEVIAARFARAPDNPEPPKKEPDTMPKTPATIHEIEAKYRNASAEFVNGQLRAKATMEDVTEAYVKHLEAEAKTTASAMDDLSLENGDLKTEIEAMEDKMSAMDPDAMDPYDDEYPNDTMEMRAMRKSIAEMTSELEAMEEEMEAMDPEAMDDEEMEAMEDDMEAMDEDIKAAVAELTKAELEQKRGKRRGSRGRRTGRAGSVANYRQSRRNSSRRRNHGASAKRTTRNRGATAEKSAGDKIRKLVAEKKAANASMADNEATRQVLQENPKLREAFVEEKNDPKAKRRDRRRGR